MNCKVNSKDVMNEISKFNGGSKADIQKILGKQEALRRVMAVGKLTSYWKDIRLCLRMLGDIVSGKYRKVPVGTIAAILGALAYVLSPLDLIPDFIIPFGYVDDAGVVSACLQLVRVDLERYKSETGAE